MSHPTASVSFSRLSDHRAFHRETVENREDRFIASLPLCRGQARIVCDGGMIFDGDVRPGLMRVLAPGERITVTRRTPAEAAILTIAGPWFRRRLDEGDYRPAATSLSVVEPILQPDPRIERLAQMVAFAPQIDPAQRGLFVEGLAQSLLAISFTRAARSPRSTSGLSDEEFARCVDYADAAIGERIDLSRWAAALDMAVGEFTRRFQRRTGMAPYQWLLNWRVDRARLLLARNGATLVDIALAVGFSSQSHFTDAFRRRVGMSPGRWRTMERAQR